ncbi:DUF397 domain-containing protein [Streptomyces sp. NPDC047971]|uniref:DUF397 domain-containing protein n=1 Tax=Streptomyces sp. NPDC047971 TaxID=3154499 RepID=UPI0033E202D3
MATNQNLTGANWRRSSYSGDTGGNCIECAPLGPASWLKSTRSGSNGGECVDVADLTAHVAVRDSKDPEGPHFLAAPAAFAAFVAAAGEGLLG